MSFPTRSVPKPYDPDRPFLITGNRQWSYGDLFSLANVWKTRIQDLMHQSSAIARTGQTHRPGTFLLLRSRNREALLLHLACAWISRVPVLPLDPAMPASELESLSATLPWDSALVDEPGAAPSIGLIHENPSLGTIREIFSWANEPGTESKKWQQMDTTELLGAPDAWWGALLTSGSSGPPKTVPHKRRSWIHAVDWTQTQTPMDPGDAWLLPLPLHHAGGMNVTIRALLTGSAVLLPRTLDPSGLAEALRTHPEIRAASMVPTQLGRLLGERTLPTLSSFHGILVGGGPIRESLLNRAVERGLPVIASYGMTETVGQIASRCHTASEETAPATTRSMSESESVAEKMTGSLPIPGPHPPSTPTLRVHAPHEVRILDEFGSPRAGEGEGVLQIRGPQLFEGYLEGRTLQRDRFDPDGWFNTGDWARLHPGEQPDEQLLEILSRRTDLILSGGENVLPTRVERVLESLPEIREALVVGIEDSEWGERVVALVIPDPDETAIIPTSDWNELEDVSARTGMQELADSIRERITGQLTPAERPKEILFVDRLPTLGPGKHDRREAKEHVRIKLRNQSG
ncbi:MAG: class I adenylate-forming enzyme family protein [Balneolaceae bacterium]